MPPSQPLPSCAIDFGGTGTRLATWRGHSLTQLQSWTGAEHAAFWRSPAGLDQLLQQLPTHVAHLGVSFSGEVDSTGRVTNSDRLFDLSGRRSRPLQDELQDRLPHARVHVLNDGTAHALGASSLAPAPLLVVVLGSWPIVRVVDRANGRLRIDRPSWLDGDAALTADALADTESRPDVVAQTLAGLLTRYRQRYSWKPRRVVLSGGLSRTLSRPALQARVAARLGPDFLAAPPAGMPDLWSPTTYADAARLPLLGARMAAEAVGLDGVCWR